MKKKLLIILALLMCVLTVSTACSKSNINLSDYVIEERDNLFYASDSLYEVSLSTGSREDNYAIDGIRNQMKEFGVLTLSRLDNSTLATDSYNYIVRIDGEDVTGTLSKNLSDNSYSADIEKTIADNAEVVVEINFTGYSFNEAMTCVSKDFSVNNASAVKIAEQELYDNIEEILDDNATIEVVTKILKDYSNSEDKTYYWYVGIVSSNGDTLGILINSNSGEVVSTKV